jgi:hypothetical protein
MPVTECVKGDKGGINVIVQVTAKTYFFLCSLASVYIVCVNDLGGKDDILTKNILSSVPVFII